MPFIGTQPEIGNYSVLDSLTASATASYTLQKNSVNFNPSSANNLLVSLNGVIQKPGSSFTVSGSTLTFSSALTSSDSIDFIMSMGEPLMIGTPSDGTITAPKLAAGSITGQTAETTVADNDTVLIHDTSANALRKMTVSNLTANAGLDGWSSNSGNLLPADASKGIYLGVNSATAANLLDDYEEGNYTPTFVATGGTAPGGQSGTGKYVKIGSVVHVHGQITWTSAGSGGSNLYVALPFTVLSNARAGAVVGLQAGIVHSANHYLTLVPEINDTKMYLIETQPDAGGHDHLNYGNVTTDGSQIFPEQTFRPLRKFGFETRASLTPSLAKVRT